jgi:L-alanine-DL-glutamate epimerase-like enolase superfamily enzyme
VLHIGTVVAAVESPLQRSWVGTEPRGQRMKKTAYLVNTARGGIIDEGALHAALTAGTLGGAGIDVFDPEPPPPDHPRLQLANLVTSPHMRVEAALDAQLGAFRDGTGKDVEFLLDLNFNFKTEGYIRLVRALERHRLMWVEIDSFDPRALALIRRSIGTPLASCESLFGRRRFKDFFENYAMDVSIVDVPWNGILEAMKIAAMAEAYEVNCAPHNFYGHMSTLMSAHFSATIPNFRIMEIDIDDVPWKDDLVTEPPRIEHGQLIMPTKPGWGAEINEEMVKRHPPK